VEKVNQTTCTYKTAVNTARQNIRVQTETGKQVRHKQSKANKKRVASNQLGLLEQDQETTKRERKENPKKSFITKLPLRRSAPLESGKDSKFKSKLKV
jgi:hypothetical protein